MSSTVAEYICEDCGSLLIHLNPTTLQSIIEVHSQLCPIKRQKILANAEAEKLKKASITRNSNIPVQATQIVGGAPPSAASIPQQVVAPSMNEGGASSSLPLTGTGTDYQTAEGPIDTGFKSKETTGREVSRNPSLGPIRCTRTTWDLGY